MTGTLGPLPSGGRVVIIGGGPGGTSCALALQRMATEMGRQLHITILEGKEFTGERHYNQCVGVLSPPLPALLTDDLQVPFPYELSQSEIEGYVLHTDREQVILQETGEPSIALRRIQFDAYMLDIARSRGITVLAARAVDLEFHDNEVVVYTENAPLLGDVVVGAFGLDEGSTAMFTRLTAYRAPQALASVVTKYHPGPEGMVAFGRFIHAFLPTHAQIEFGAITPKSNHLTINVAGSRADVPSMQSFLALSEVQAALPCLSPARRQDSSDLRFFKGRFPCSLARHHYGDRYVMVGDAAGLVRAFKGKGVTSAVQTGIRAARTILQAGISRQAFHSHYREANRDIIQDLPYGQGMRLLTILLSRYGLLGPVVRAARHDRSLQTALFDAVSAHAPYRDVVARLLRPTVIHSILTEMMPHKRGSSASQSPLS